MKKHANHHIIDEALRNNDPPMLDPVARKRAYESLVRAKRYHLSDEASYTAGHVAGSIPELILQNHQFAIPPYRNMYIEYNVERFTQGLRDANPNTKLSSEDDRIGEIDITTGYLISAMDTSDTPDYRVWVVANTKSYPAFFAMLGVGFNPLLPMRRTMFFGDQVKPSKGEWLRLALLLGTGINHLPSEDVRRNILTHWDMHLQFDMKSRTLNWDILKHSAGEGRNVMTLLLLLNMPKRITYTSVAASRGMYRNKIMPYAAHSVIHLDLNNPRTYARYLIPHGGTHATPRRHEVAGHYYHKPGWARERCTQPQGHEWPAVPNNIEFSHQENYTPRWVCPVCGARRKWVTEYERGDASKGMTDQEYEVT